MNIANPYFSVVIPVYNKGPHIDRCINSVLGQSFCEFEIIIVNDASSDNSLAEIQKFTDPRIRILHRDKPGPGGYAARNLATMKARSNWIAFLDADDKWNPDHLCKMHELINQFPDASVLGCGWETYSPDDLRKEKYPTPYFSLHFRKGSHFLTFRDYLKAECSKLQPIWTSIACIKKGILQEVGGFPDGKCKRGGDVDTWLRCIERAGGMSWSAHIGAVYFRDSVNMVTRTQAIRSNVEKESVVALLPKYSGQDAKLLKQFSNKRTINAWKHSQKLRIKAKIRILSQLFWDVDLLKNSVYVLLSIFPPSFFGYFRTFYWESKFKFKKINLKLRKSKFGDFVKWARMIFYRFFIKKAIDTPKLITENIRVLSDGDRATFFGYHDKVPLNKEGTKLLAMSTSSIDTRPDSECTKLNLGYFIQTNSKRNNGNFHIFGETKTWCWQQGCMLQWFPLNESSHVVYNTIVDNEYGSLVYDLNTQKIVRKFKHPIYSIDPSGRLASSLNFSRLGRLRPGYGYSLLPDKTSNQTAPNSDGLFVFDLITGEKRLLISLAELAKDSTFSNAHHYINHATFSPSGNRLVFFHLCADNSNQTLSLRVCEVSPYTGKWQEVESARIVSHYCWRYEDQILATTLDKFNKWHYSVYDLVKRTRKDLDLTLNGDGHPMFHPKDKNIFLTDTYPDNYRDQHIFVVNMETEEIKAITALFSPIKYSKQVRCDLHPRWDREGQTIIVDSTHYGKRKVIVLDSCRMN